MAVISKKAILPGNRIRVLVVDDSVVIRRLVTHALEEDPALEVVGSACDGAMALTRIAQLNPDVVTLDVEMPKMNGLEVLRQLRKGFVRPRIVLFSTLTERGAETTLEALSLGADDYVAKASNAGSLDKSMASLRSELIPKIRQFFVFPQAHPTILAPRVVQPAWGAPRLRMVRQPAVVAIGISTGGPTALGVIVPQIPADFPIPILIVQHMPPLFTRFLAERLQNLTPLCVEEASDGSKVTPGKIFIARGDYHMRIKKSGDGAIVTLDQSAPENSCRPAVDVMFRSVAEVYGAAAVSAVMTGMGQDGMRGAEALKAKGAYVIAQDEASSVVWGMPGAVVRAGLADCVIPLNSVVPEILRRIRGG